MKKIMALAVILTAAALPLAAGDIHGTVVAAGAKGGADVVVYVGRIDGKTFAPPAEHTKVIQKGMRFNPHVQVVLVGTTVDFVNSDTAKHNVFSVDTCADKFDLGLWSQGESKSYTFKRECAATLLCNVHPEMEAFAVAVPTPYFAIAAADGSYEIAGVPNGSYTVKVWHPRLKKAEQSVTVNGPTEVNFEIKK